MARPLVPLISLDALVTAALELVDEAGDFSLPKLAKKIGVSQSSIYNHVSGRDAIIELMRGRIISESPFVLSGDMDWEASLRAIVRSYRDAFARHPRLAPLLVLQTVEHHDVLSLYENLALVLDKAGFKGRDVMSAISTIDSFALGFALDLAAPEVVWAPPAKGYPALTQALTFAGSSDERGEAAFEFGLEILMAGLRATLQRTARN
ncbi:TetR/AcrR family transcriptional regulator C-terminal domain-containing protein [Paenarthrobacter ilicis]|uniref:AcrR family transcriptional regulator n=1 Tax=Paenarthrobacter ilicis TaxID=43665 RepID=A0ABX0TN00_9MICC|nr:TetR/AcrR family transcriptional regulator C-terminal domain-containing protein [Paenarthrobacter ilicis]MBM7793167.1 AcrR family transcriptional regulator [Paenarthrobacter ilicis]NIJ02057.1 AcrR family transcriptional regulator [Paenarthrobacter ilicis]